MSAATFTDDKVRVAFWIAGAPSSKANLRRIVKGKNGKPMSIKSAAALKWMEDAALQVPSWARLGIGSPKRPVGVTLCIWYENKRRDMDAELVYDLLQRRGVITNDRYIYEKHTYMRFSKEKMNRIYKQP